MVENYRGIAILPTLGKRFESIVCSIISKRVSVILPAFQHGFVKRRSTSTNLLEFTNFAINVIESGYQLDVVYTDFQTASDRVIHRILLNKLKGIGILSFALK